MQPWANVLRLYFMRSSAVTRLGDSDSHDGSVN